MDPVRRGFLFSKLAGMVGMSIDEVGAMLRKLGEGVRHERQTPNPETRNEDTPRSHRVDVSGLTGLDAAEGWVLGALLAQPALYDKVRQDMALRLFVKLRGLAATLIEYLENHPDPGACQLNEIMAELGDEELVRQAIELERQTSDWMDPQFSPAHVKMLKQSMGDRGLTVEMVLLDSLKRLREERGGEDPGVTADLGGGDRDGGEGGLSPEEAELKELMGLVARKVKQGGDRGNVGLGR